MGCGSSVSKDVHENVRQQYQDQKDLNDKLRGQIDADKRNYEDQIAKGRQREQKFYTDIMERIELEKELRQEILMALAQDEMQADTETAKQIHNIGDIYYKRRFFKEAVSMYDRAISIWYRTLGSDHPVLNQARDKAADCRAKTAQASYNPPPGFGNPSSSKQPSNQPLYPGQVGP